MLFVQDNAVCKCSNLRNVRCVAVRNRFGRKERCQNVLISNTDFRTLEDIGWMATDGQFRELQIIDNIYENPELLSDTTTS